MLIISKNRPAKQVCCRQLLLFGILLLVELFHSAHSMDSLKKMAKNVKKNVGKAAKTVKHVVNPSSAQRDKYYKEFFKGHSEFSTSSQRRSSNMQQIEYNQQNYPYHQLTAPAIVNEPEIIEQSSNVHVIFCLIILINV